MAGEADLDTVELLCGAAGADRSQLYKVRPLRAAARCIQGRGGEGQMTGPDGARSAWTSIKWKVVGSHAFIATRTVHVRIFPH